MLFGYENSRFSRLDDFGVNDSALMLLIDLVESSLKISIQVNIFCLMKIFYFGEYDVSKRFEALTCELDA